MVPIYDRTELIQHTVNTVERNMVEGAVLIFAVLIIFLRRIWASLVVIVVVPLSLLFAFILIDLKNVSANLISLGAIDFGIIVDSAVVLVEAVIVKVTLEMRQGASPAHMRQSMLNTTVEMVRPILFFKGHTYHCLYPYFHVPARGRKNLLPMAYTLTFALLGSLIISLTLVPVLLSYLLGPRLTESHNPLIERMERYYLRILKAALRHPRKLFLGAGLALALSLASWPIIGTEFMPKLDEGNVWLTITLPTPVSLNKAKELERDIRASLLEFREANSVLISSGAPRTAPTQKASIISRS